MPHYKFILPLSIVATLSMPNTGQAFVSDTTQNVGQNMSLVLISTPNLEQDALSFIEDLSKRGIGFLENSDLSEEARKKQFRKLLEDSFDMKTIGRFALGRYWKTSTAAQQKEYLSLFENMIIEVYSRRFSEYNGEALNVLSARTDSGADVIVASEIVPQNGAKISVDWRVRKKKDNSFKVVDIMVEGVSMSLTQRSDFASVIQRGGGSIDILLAHLRP